MADGPREYAVAPSFFPVLWEASVTHTPLMTLADELGDRLGFAAALWTEPGFANGRVHESDRPRFVTFREALGGERYAELEYRVAAADGTLVWLREAITVEKEPPLA